MWCTHGLKNSRVSARMATSLSLTGTFTCAYPIWSCCVVAVQVVVLKLDESEITWTKHRWEVLSDGAHFATNMATRLSTAPELQLGHLLQEQVPSKRCMAI